MCYLTAGQLKKLLENVPDDARILYERIEDVYFKEHGWNNVVVEKPNGIYPDEKDQYIPAFCAFFYNGNVYVTAHY